MYIIPDTGWVSSFYASTLVCTKYYSLIGTALYPDFQIHGAVK